MGELFERVTNEALLVITRNHNRDGFHQFTKSIYGADTATQISAKRFATPFQPNLSRTTRAASRPNCFAASRFLSSSTTDAAKVSGVSAMRNSLPSVTGSPSAPTVVDTMGFSIAIASKIFKRVPPPILNGTT